MPEGLILSQTNAFRQPGFSNPCLKWCPTLRGLHSPGVRKRCQMILSCYFWKSSILQKCYQLFWVKKLDWGKTQKTTHTFLVDLHFFLVWCKCRKKFTEMKTISDKNDCNSHAFLSWPVSKTESFWWAEWGFKYLVSSLHFIHIYRKEKQ